MLRAGGSAVDAAIAAQMVLTLVEPQSSGIGGGAFLMHFRKADRKVEAYDGRETAPATIRPDVFLTADGKRRSFRDVSTGGAAVGVPGVIRMLAMAHRDHGRLPWNRLFEPAIAYAENGFSVSPRLNKMISRAKDMKNFPAARAYFYTAAGDPLAVGHRLRNPGFAVTLRRIAREGRCLLRRRNRGRHRRGRSECRPQPGRNDGCRYRKLQGQKTNPGLRRIPDIPAVRYAAANIRWTNDAADTGAAGKFRHGGLRPGSLNTIHLISEASRLAYADRSQYIGDPDFVSVPVKGMLDRAYLRRRAGRITATESMGKALPGRPPGAGRAQYAPDKRHGLPSTSHLSVIDRDGNAVSMTMSIERAFGSRLMVRGFLLNNQLTDFAYMPRRNGRLVANAVAPGKRPRSSMSPMLVFDKYGELFATVGSPGGSRIIAYVAKTLIGLLDWNLDMQAAIDLPTHVNRNGATEIEKGTDLEKLADDLRRLGHEVQIRTLTSGLHGIRVTPRGYDGGADKRREGLALGD